MIYLYWPYKRIPQWLERIEAAEKGAIFPDVFQHRGFGIVLAINGHYVAWGISGAFCYISKAENVNITGGGKGVYCADKFSTFLKYIKFARSQP